MRSLWLAAAALCLHGAVRAQDDKSVWSSSGYYTLGTAQVRSSLGDSFARDQTQSQPRGWEVDSRLGLQADARLGERWGFTGQLVLRPRVPGTPLAESVEWAFLRWNPTPDWQLRLGRTSPDLFLFADVRSVGVAYPWVRPSQEFYAWMPLQSADGLDLSRSWGDEEVLWRLKLSYSLGRLRAAAQATATPGDAKVRAIRALTLSRETPQSRLKFSYLRGHLDLSGAPVLAQFDAVLAQLQSQLATVLPEVTAQAAQLRDGLGVQSEARYLAFGAQRDLGDWSLWGEWSRAWGQASQTNARRGYVSVARRFDSLTPFVIAGRSRLDRPPLALPLGWQAQLTPLIGPMAAAQATAVGVWAAQSGNLGRIGQRSLGFGLRWDLRPNLALKGQWDQVRVAADGRSLWSWRADGPAQAFKAQVFSLSLDGSF